MRNASNREMIIQKSVHLFALKGYANVSMREIANEVGIKASSIYNHYSGKEALLESIFNYFREKIEVDIFKELRHAEGMSLKECLERNMQISDALFTQPMISDISKIVIKEQFHNESSRQLLLTELIQKPLKIYTDIFQKFMNEGRMKRIDPLLAAKEFQSYFVLRFYENCLKMKNDDIDFQINQAEQSEHIRMFLEHYAISD